MRKMGQHRTSLWARLSLGTFLFLAIFAPFIANDRPLFYHNAEGIYWPILTKATPSDPDWKEMEGRLIFSPIPFHPEETSLSERYLAPLSKVTIENRTFRHWLGTDRLGRDVAAGLVHGCRKSLWVGLLAMLVASIFGLLLGALAGFYGDFGVSKSWWSLALTVGAACYLIYLVYYGMISIYVFGLAMLALLGAQWFSTSVRTPRSIPLPMDAALLRSSEIIATLPTLLFLMVLGTLVGTSSLSVLALIIALLRWPRFALFVRSEVQKLKSENYVTAAKISGLSDMVILQKLILPKTLVSVSVLFAFGLASTIMLESTLSFLGIGVPLDTVTWGSILGQSRENVAAWWLALFPGLAIGLVIMTFNHVGEYLRLTTWS